MLRYLTRRTVMAAVVVGTVVATSTAVAAIQDDGDRPTDIRAAMTAATPTRAVSDVDPVLVASFGLFRDRPASGMPADAVAQVGSPNRFGRNPALARQIETVTGAGWVIPGDGFVCIVMPDPIDGYGTSCLPVEAAVGRGLSLSMGGNMPNGKVAEVLLVPDGKRAVTDQATRVMTDAGVATVFSTEAGALRAAG